MRASCADLTLGQCLHAYLIHNSIAAAVVAAATAATAAIEISPTVTGEAGSTPEGSS